jgi:DNA-binding transcriptional MerR regulator
MAKGKAQAGLTVSELEAKLGLTRRVIHSWIAGGLIGPPSRRGPRSTYDEAQVLRIEAIQKLRARKMGLAAIKRWLLSATRDQVEALVRPPAPAAPVAAPVGVHGERWERVGLLPGLELHVRSDAGPLVQRLASEIAERYRTSVSSG